MVSEIKALIEAQKEGIESNDRWNFQSPALEDDTELFGIRTTGVRSDRKSKIECSECQFEILSSGMIKKSILDWVLDDLMRKEKSLGFPICDDTI